jgi:vacuolar protein sorting-associated protein VTA1
MAPPADPHVKGLQPFLQRAEELKGADPKVAYYCRVFAMEEGLKVSDKSGEMIATLGSLMETLERTKPDAGLVSPEEDCAYCENFALRIFAKADALDRGGGAGRTKTAKTAKMLYVASVFFEILHQFPNAPDEDTLAKQRYAAWRAGELSACAREGKTPPSPPGEAETPDVSETEGWTRAAIGGDAVSSRLEENADGVDTPPPPPAAYTPPSAPPALPDVSEMEARPRARGDADAREVTRVGTSFANAATPSPPARLPPVNYAEGIGVASVAEAQKHAKFAVSALGFEDVPTAIENLRKALALLTGRLAADGSD